MKPNIIRLGIADDHKIFRMGLEAALSIYPDISIVFQADNGLDLLSKLNQHEADVILLDIRMPELSGLDALHEIRKNNKDLKIIILTMHDSDNYVVRMFEEDANAYLLKDADPDEIYYTIQACLQNGKYISESISSVLVKRLVQENKIGKGNYSNPENFTEKEIQILQLIFEEKTTPEIAKLTSINQRTLEGIRQNMYNKAGARNTIGLVVYALRHKLIEVDLN